VVENTGYPTRLSRHWHPIAVDRHRLDHKSLAPLFRSAYRSLTVKTHDLPQYRLPEQPLVGHGQIHCLNADGRRFIRRQAASGSRRIGKVGLRSGPRILADGSRVHQVNQ